MDKYYEGVEAYDDFLAHYGVLGMKWGVRKAKQYDRDLAQNRRYQANYDKKEELSEGKITKTDYKNFKKKTKEQYKKELKYIKKSKYKNLPIKDLPISSIYNKSKKEAYSKIPGYGAKSVINAINNIDVGAANAILAASAAVTMPGLVAAGVPAAGIALVGGEYLAGVIGVNTRGAIRGAIIDRVGNRGRPRTN